MASQLALNFATPPSTTEDYAFHSKGALEAFGHFSNNEAFSDVKFKVGVSESSAETIYGHRLILGARSPVFHKMFTAYCFGSFTKPILDDIRINDIHPNVFKIFLQYLYEDKLDGKSLLIDDILNILYSAKKYMVASLVKKCEDYVMEKLNPSNVLQIVFSVCVDDGSELQIKCHRMQEQNTSDIVKTALFLQLSEKQMCEFLSREASQLTEIKLFEALVLWAKQQCAKTKLVAIPNNLRQVMGKTIFQIRFPTMSTAEFTKNVVPTKILSNDEMLNIYIANGNGGTITEEFEQEPENDTAGAALLKQKFIGRKRINVDIAKCARCGSAIPISTVYGHTNSSGCNNNNRYCVSYGHY